MCYICDEYALREAERAEIEAAEAEEAELEALLEEYVTVLVLEWLLERLFWETVLEVLAEELERELAQEGLGDYLRGLLDDGEDDEAEWFDLTDDGEDDEAEWFDLTDDGEDDEAEWFDLTDEDIGVNIGCGCAACREVFGNVPTVDPVFSEEAPFAGILSGLNGLSLSALVVEHPAIARIREVLADPMGSSTVEEDYAFALALLGDEQVLTELGDTDYPEHIPGIRHAITEFVNERGLVRPELKSAMADYDYLKGIESTEKRQVRERMEALETEQAELEERLALLDEQLVDAREDWEQVRYHA